MIALRYLCRADVELAGGGDWARAIEDVREATRLLRSGQADMVPESVMPIGSDPRENAYGLPARVGGVFDAAGLKWAVHRVAAVGELPSITNATFLNRLSDGRPLGLVESALLTRMRTAAVSAIAMEMRPARAIETIAVLGAGAQARTHIEMVGALFPSVTSIRVWNRSVARRDAMLAELARLPGPARVAAGTIAEAIEGADVVLACTTSSEPLLGEEAIRPGRLIVQVGYNEITFEAIDAADHVVVDLWGDFAQNSAKSLFRMYRAGRFAPERVAADLTHLVVEGWRPEDDAALVFSNFGLNVFDIALAARVLRNAEARGIGTVLPFV